MDEPRRNVALFEGTRIYARIAPREWSVPARVELEQRISDVGLNIRGRDGDWGLNGDGALSVWGHITGAHNDMIVTNATQWFQSNGELWAVNSNCFSENSGSQFFASALPFTPLDEFLRKGIAAIRAVGGKGPIGIKLGAGDLTDTVLPGQYQSQRFPAVSARVDVGEEIENWTPRQRRALLFRFWNALMGRLRSSACALHDRVRASSSGSATFLMGGGMMSVETRSNVLDRRQLVCIGGSADRNEAQGDQRWQTGCTPTDQVRCHESLSPAESSEAGPMFWRAVNLHSLTMCTEAHQCPGR